MFKQELNWSLNVALYGLEEASLQLHFKSKLHLKQYKLDPTLFYEHNQRGELIGMLGTHVDDFLKTEWKIQTLDM